MKSKLVFISLILVLLVTPLALACAKEAPAPAPAPALAPAPKPAPAPPPPTPKPAPPSQSEEKITWIFSATSGANPNAWIAYPYPRFQEMIKERTNGRLILDTKPDLLGAKEGFEGVSTGKADIALQRIPFVSGTYPLFDYGSLPFFFANAYEYEKAVNDPDMLKIMDKAFAELGLVKLFDAPSTTPNDAIFANKAIKVVEDFKGVKMRASGLLPTMTLDLLEASPLTMSVMEISEAMHRGTIDAVLTSVSYGLNVGMTDVSSYINYWPILSAYGGAYVVNKDKWDALTPDLQEAVRQVSAEIEGQEFFGTDVAYKVARSGVSAAGLEVVTPDEATLNEAREIVKSVVDKWLELAGPDGKAVLDIAAKYASGAEALLGK